MSIKKLYKVAITETLRRIVLVHAFSETEARRRAMDAWCNGEVRLEVEDSEGAEFYILGNDGCDESSKGLDHIESKDDL